MLYKKFHSATKQQNFNFSRMKLYLNNFYFIKSKNFNFQRQGEIYASQLVTVQFLLNLKIPLSLLLHMKSLAP